jgi:hypothetical protein
MDDDLRSRYRINRPNYVEPRRPQPRSEPVSVPQQPASPAAPAASIRSAPNAHRPKPAAKPKEELFLPEAAAVTRPKKTKKSKKLWLGVVCLLIIVGGACFYYKNQSKPPAAAAPSIPLPASISSKVNFPVYYPSSTPAGYTYSNGSAAVQNGLVFFKMFNGNKFVFFTEQASPSKPVDLSALPNYQQFSVPAGTAAIGTNLGKPAGLVLSGSTLINVSTSGGVTAGELNDIFRSLAPVPKQ